MSVYKDRWPKPRPYSGNSNSSAEIVEHIMAVSPPPIIKNPIQPPLAATETLSEMSELHLYGCACTPNSASMCQVVQRQEMQLVSDILYQMLNASKENSIQIPTGGTVRLGVNQHLKSVEQRSCHTAFEIG